MNISATVRSLLLDVREAVSMVLKPAVLAVTELKSDARILSFVLISESRLGLSNI